MTLVPYDGGQSRYSAVNQCNHATARWLRAMGCRVSGPALFSRFADARGGRVPVVNDGRPAAR